jgi:hypothetical protein
VSKKRNSQMRNKLYIAIVVNVIFTPGLLVFIYDKFAGGLLNGLGGSWREGIVSPNVLLYFVNPLLLALSYYFSFKQFKLYMQERPNITAIIFAVILLVIATLITLVGVFWALLTT